MKRFRKRSMVSIFKTLKSVKLNEMKCFEHLNKLPNKLLLKRGDLFLNKNYKRIVFINVILHCHIILDSFVKNSGNSHG